MFLPTLFKKSFPASIFSLGYKSSYSTDLRIYTLKEYIAYHNNRGTTVYVTFLDVCKASDMVINGYYLIIYLRSLCSYL